MKLKAEFQRRLSRLYLHLYSLLLDDASVDVDVQGHVKLGSLMSLMFSVLSYYWSLKGDVLKK